MDKFRKAKGVIPYISPNWNTRTSREIAENLKKNDPEAITKAAAEMAKFVPDNAVLIPMPGSSGKVTEGSWTMNLTNEISKLTGRPVVVALEGAEHESKQKAKQRKERGPGQKELGFRQVAEIPEGTMPIFVDNTVGTGITADAARMAMGGGITLAYTKTNLSPGIIGLKNLTVTYESKKNGGGLIPLSQRFNISKRDVRYSFAETQGLTANEQAYARELDTVKPETIRKVLQEAAAHPVSNFSMAGEPFQVRKDGLVAVHNLNEQSLLADLKMNGFPMPSIALTRSGKSWQAYGPISVFFGMDTVDPSLFGNRIYNGDAYTPTLGNRSIQTAEEAIEALRRQPERDLSQALGMTNLFRNFKKVRTLDEARQKAWQGHSENVEENNRLYKEATALEKRVFEQIKAEMRANNGSTMNFQDEITIPESILLAAEEIEARGETETLDAAEKREILQKTINNHRQEEGQRQLNLSRGVLNTILEYIEAASKLHSGNDMLESKPNRIIDFSKVSAVLVPSDIQESTIAALVKAGVSREGIFEYSTNDRDADNRQAVMRQIPASRAGAAFSMAQLNKEYEAAIKSGDVETQQRIVDEAANRAFKDSEARYDDGTLVTFYHGTKEQFNIFDTNVQGGKNGTAEGYGIYLTDRQEISEKYGDRQIAGYVNAKRIAHGMETTFKRSELVDLIRASCEQEAKAIAEENGYDDIREALKDTWISNYTYTHGYSDIEQAYKEVARLIMEQNSNDNDIIREVMAGMGIRDYGTAMDFYHNILTPTTGFDAMWTTWKNNEGEVVGNILLAFDSSQIKSSDPITYDDQGEVIQISERFNTDSKDIRYSFADMRGKSLEEQLERIRKGKAKRNDVLEFATEEEVAHLGLNAPLGLRQSVLTKETRDPKGTQKSGHKLTYKQILEAKKIILIPVAKITIRDKTILVAEPLEKSNKPIVAVLEKRYDYYKNGAYDIQSIHERDSVSTIYGRFENGKFIANEQAVITKYKENANDILSLSPAQFGAGKDVISAIEMLSQDKNDVNINFSIAQKDEKESELRKAWYEARDNRQAVMRQIPANRAGAAFSMAQMEKDYEAAIESGDVETQQRIVDEAAERAMKSSRIRTPDGKLRKVYHGTYSGDFTVFDKNLIGQARVGDTGFFGRGFYFAYSKGEASMYGSKVMDAYVNITNPFNFQTELNTYDGKRTYGYNSGRAVFVVNWAEKFPELAKFEKITVGKKGTDELQGISMDEFAKEFKNVYENVEFKVEELNTADGKEWLVTADPHTASYTDKEGKTHTWEEYGFKRRVVSKEAAEDRLEMACEYLENNVYDFLRIPASPTIVMSSNLTKVLQERGYDGVIQSEEGDEVVAFDSSQIKSADPVTYDDNGKVIPISERFNEDSQDIRYSTATDESDEIDRKIRLQIKENIKEINKLKPVAYISSDINLSKYKEKGAKSEWAQQKMWANEFAESFNRVVTRDGFGDVNFNKQAIKRGLSYLFDSRQVFAFQAVPDVVKYGKEINYHEKHKGGKADSHTFAAPIIYDNEPAVLGVVVRFSEELNRYKAHKVYLPDGSVLTFDTEKTGVETTPTSQKAQTERTRPVSDNNLPQNNNNSKRDDNNLYSIASDTNMDVNMWMEGVSESSLQTEGEKMLLRAYKDLQMKVRVTDLKLDGYRKRLKELEANKNPTYQEREDIRALKNKIEVNEQKKERLENELFQVTDSEGYAGLMYRQTRILNDFVYGKTQDQVRQAVDSMVEEVKKVRAEIAKNAETLKKMAESQAVRTMKSYLNKADLSQAATNLRKEYGSTMNKGEIENRLAAMSLKLAQGENIMDDAAALAQDLLDKTRGIGSEALERMKGTTFVIGKGQLEELKATHQTMKEIRSRLRGSGIKVRALTPQELKQNVKPATLETQWEDFRSYDQSLPELGNEKDQLENLVSWVESQMEMSRGLNQYGVDMADVTAVVAATAGTVSGYIVEDPKAKAQIDSLMKDIQSIAKQADSAADAMDRMGERFEQLELAGAKATGWASVLQRDVNVAIDYYSRMAKQAAEVERAKVRQNVVETLKSEHAQKLLEKEHQYQELLKKDKKARELKADNEHLKKQVDTNIKRLTKRITNETDTKNIPEQAKPLARQLISMLLYHDQNAGFGMKILDAYAKDREALEAKLRVWESQNGPVDLSRDLDFLFVNTPEGPDSSVLEQVQDDLIAIEDGLKRYDGGQGKGLVTLQERKQALEQIRDAVGEIVNVIKHQAEVEIQGRQWIVSEYAMQMYDEMGRSRFKGEWTGKMGKGIGAARRAVVYGNTTAPYFFKNLRNGMAYHLYRDFCAAENRNGLEVKRSQEAFKEIAEDCG